MSFSCSAGIVDTFRASTVFFVAPTVTPLHNELSFYIKERMKIIQRKKALMLMISIKNEKRKKNENYPKKKSTDADDL